MGLCRVCVCCETVDEEGLVRDVVHGRDDRGAGGVFDYIHVVMNVQISLDTPPCQPCRWLHGGEGGVFTCSAKLKDLDLPLCVRFALQKSMPAWRASGARAGDRCIPILMLHWSVSVVCMMCACTPTLPPSLIPSLSVFSSAVRDVGV